MRTERNTFGLTADEKQAKLHSCSGFFWLRMKGGNRRRCVSPPPPGEEEVLHQRRLRAASDVKSQQENKEKTLFC